MVAESFMISNNNVVQYKFKDINEPKMFDFKML